MKSKNLFCFQIKTFFLIFLSKLILLWIEVISNLLKWAAFASIIISSRYLFTKIVQITPLTSIKILTSKKDRVLRLGGFGKVKNPSAGKQKLSFLNYWQPNPALLISYTNKITVVFFAIKRIKNALLFFSLSKPPQHFLSKIRFLFFKNSRNYKKIWWKRMNHLEKFFRKFKINL